VNARDDVVTFDELEGFQAISDLGTVTGSASRPRSRLRATFRSLGMLIGLSPGELLGDAEQLRGDALDDLRRTAERLGANAVVGLEFDVSESADGACKVTATGRAMLVGPTPAEHDVEP
jgi:uncharacterized protein YbjQ (UPF0145 family)